MIVTRLLRPLVRVGASLAVLACSRGLEGAYATLPAVGTPVPAFSFVGLDSSRWSNAQLADTPAVLALWSSSCSASREAVSAIAALSADYTSRGVRVLLLADDAEAATVRPRLAGLPNALDIALAAGTLTRTFSQTAVGPWRRSLGLPSFLVVDRTGRIVHRQVGIEQDPQTRLQAIRARLDTLLAGPTAP